MKDSAFIDFFLTYGWIFIVIAIVGHAITIKLNEDPFNEEEKRVINMYTEQVCWETDRGTTLCYEPEKLVHGKADTVAELKNNIDVEGEVTVREKVTNR